MLQKKATYQVLLLKLVMIMIFILIDNDIFLYFSVENHHHHGTGSGCRYPSWLTEHHTWHSLNHGHVYHFSPRNGTLRKSIPGAGPDHDIRAACHRILNVTNDVAQIVTHYTIGW